MGIVLLKIALLSLTEVFVKDFSQSNRSMHVLYDRYLRLGSAKPRGSKVRDSQFLGYILQRRYDGDNLDVRMDERLSLQPN